MKKILFSACSLFALSALTASPSFAASMDYNALQELFGEPVTTAATGTPQKSSEVATNMTIITSDQIRQSGTRDIPTLIGALVPGMDTLQTGRQGFDVGVRGYQRPNQPRLLVLVDGRQVFTDDYSRTIWASLPLNIDDIRQIEIVKGPSSALFGSNAAGGVVNIITSNPLYDNKNMATVTVGTNGVTSGDAVATYKTGSFGGIKMTAGGFNMDEFSTGRSSLEDSTQTDPSRRYVTGVGAFQVNSKVQANTEFTFSQGQNTEAAFSNILFGQKFNTYSARAGFSWDTPYGTVSNNNYFNHTRAVPNLSDYAAVFAMNTDLFVSQLEDQFKIGADHTVRLALEYRNKGFDLEYPSLAANPQDPKIVEDQYALGGTWLWNITNDLSWTNALRVDHLKIREDGTLPVTDPLEKSDYSHTINALSANSGLVYKPTDLDSFRVTYGRGLQMPSLINTGWSIDLVRPSYYVDLLGNPLLKPTYVQNYEIGYDRKIPSLYSTANFSTFYQLNQDIANIKINATPILIGGVPAYTAWPANLGNSHGWGIEIGLKGSNKGFRWDGSYSFSRVSDSEGVASALNYRGSAPVHHFRLNGGYTWGKWEFDANGQYVSATDMMRRVAYSSLRESANGYITLGGRVGYSINDRFTVAAMGSQLNQSRLSASPYPALERQLMLSFTGNF